VVRAAVNFPANASVEARVSNGSANADFNYRVTGTNNNAAALDYFLSFPAPKFSRTETVAYSLSSPSDSNGGTYSYVNTKSAGSRSAIDIYVDGLPVFTSASYFDHNSAYEDAFGKLEWTAGAQVADPNVLIYLGKIPSGGSFTVDVVERAEAAANSTTCGYTDFIGFQTPYSHVNNCFDLKETVSIPTTNNSIAVNVFSLVVN
jgi:hypothetical protein